MRTYEILYFLPITAENEEIKNIKAKVNDILTKQQASIVSEEEIGKRKLAYMIKRARHGYYILTTFSCLPDKIGEINHQLELMPEILRHRIVIKPRHTKPSQQLSTDNTTQTTKSDNNELSSLSSKDEQQSAQQKTTEKTKINDNKDKIDIKELDKKIDELLSHDLTEDLKEKL